KELDVDLALNFDVADEALIERLTQRRSCPNPECQAVYHLVYNPPKCEGKCDKCGSELYQRDDDKAETVKNRLKTYHEKTQPLVDYYTKAGKICTIPGIGEIDEIFAKVKKAIQ
ncbi:MAG: nucleoside monophosphate kinase, partial [Candidatus Methanomethylophilus sp.]|nr:nucleoside monophosphate kinase [Methanomethylophilus sp.]